MIKLRNCPMCGNSVNLYHNKNSSMGVDKLVIVCPCGMMYSTKNHTLEELAELWNQNINTDYSILRIQDYNGAVLERAFDNFIDNMRD